MMRIWGGVELMAEGNIYSLSFFIFLLVKIAVGVTKKVTKRSFLLT